MRIKTLRVVSVRSYEHLPRDDLGVENDPVWIDPAFDFLLQFEQKASCVIGLSLPRRKDAPVITQKMIPSGPRFGCCGSLLDVSSAFHLVQLEQKVP